MLDATDDTNSQWKEHHTQSRQAVRDKISSGKEAIHNEKMEHSRASTVVLGHIIHHLKQGNHLTGGIHGHLRHVRDLYVKSRQNPE